MTWTEDDRQTLDGADEEEDARMTRDEAIERLAMASEDERVVIMGYPKRQTTGWVLQSWGGQTIGPITLVRTWRQYVSGSPVTLHAWRMALYGRTLYGRNSGEGMALRLSRARRSR